MLPTFAANRASFPAIVLKGSQRSWARSSQCLIHMSAVFLTIRPHLPCPSLSVPTSRCLRRGQHEMCLMSHEHTLMQKPREMAAGTWLQRRPGKPRPGKAAWRMDAFKVQNLGALSTSSAHREAQTSHQLHLGPPPQSCTQPTPGGRASRPNFPRHLLFSVFVTSS